MIVNGIDIPEATLASALAALGTSPFALRDLQTALETSGVETALSYDAAKRVLQRERKAGTLIHDQTTGMWSAPAPATAPATAPVPPPSSSPGNGQTIPLAPTNAGNVGNPPTPQKSTATAPLPLPDLLAMVLTYLACISAVFALALINASFAWEVAETDAFRFAFVTGLMASDIMRPLLVARGLWEITRKRFTHGLVALLVAFSLSPVSVLSSTAVISAALHLGAEEIEQDSVVAQTQTALQGEYERAKLLADQAWAVWKAECDRGGCGPEAAKREATAKALEAEAKARLDAMLVMSGDTGSDGPSSFLSRTVKAYKGLGLFEEGTEAILPLLLALTLEIAAIFGPGLLLANRKGSA